MAQVDVLAAELSQHSWSDTGVASEELLQAQVLQQSWTSCGKSILLVHDVRTWTSKLSGNHQSCGCAGAAWQI
jgi:hypothetical protein